MDQDILALEAQNAPLTDPEQANEASQAPLQQSPVASLQPPRLDRTNANRLPAVLDNREAVSALGLGYSRLDVLPERAGDSPEVASARRQEVAQLEQLVGLTGAKLHESGTPELPGHIYVDVNNKPLTRANDRLRDINAEMREVRRSGDSPEDKRHKLDGLSVARNALLKAVVEDSKTAQGER